MYFAKSGVSVLNICKAVEAEDVTKVTYCESLAA